MKPMRSLPVQYPWKNLEKGQGFFIPCLDTETVKADGLQKALGYRFFDARAKVGIKQGRIGVLFYRIPSSLK
jgi:hypothetical protein